MKLKLTFSVLVFFVLFQLGCSKKQAENKNNRIDNASTIVNVKGKLSCKTSHKDFGIIKSGQKLECPFVFKNLSNQSVHILDYQASCNCTEIKFDKKVISPGDSLNVLMIVNTKGKRTGRHTSTVVITTDGERKFYDLNADFEIEKL